MCWSRELSAAWRIAVLGIVDTVVLRSAKRSEPTRLLRSVQSGVRRHRGEHCERATLAAEHVAPEVLGIVREDVLRQSRLDDPGALLELAVELTGAPAGVAGGHACPAELAEQVGFHL